MLETLLWEPESVCATAIVSLCCCGHSGTTVNVRLFTAMCFLGAPTNPDGVVLAQPLHKPDHRWILEGFASRVYRVVKGDRNLVLPAGEPDQVDPEEQSKVSKVQDPRGGHIY